MNILALDTSGATASTAVAREGFLLGEISLRHGKTHSQKVVPMMESLLNMLDMKPSDIGALAVANGPGSFTGVRIGVVTMKAMAYALNIPLVEVSSLMALAYTLGEQSGVVCPIMDARNRQVYTGIYQIDREGISEIHGEMGTTIETLADLVKDLNAVVHFVGDAVPLYREYIRERGLPALYASDDVFTHRAASVAHLAWMKYKKGKVGDAFSASPNYLRKSQAERMKDQQTGGRRNA